MISNIVRVVGGAIVGSAVTFFVVRKKEQERADKEIDQCRAYFKEKYERKVKELEAKAEAKEEPEVTETVVDEDEPPIVSYVPTVEDRKTAVDMINELHYGNVSMNDFDIPVMSNEPGYYSEYATDDTVIYEITHDQINSHYDADTREEEYNLYKDGTCRSSDDTCAVNLDDMIGRAFAIELREEARELAVRGAYEHVFYDETNNILVTVNVFGYEFKR